MRRERERPDTLVAQPQTQTSAQRQALPEDRFDRLEKVGRVGAHRISARPRRLWVYLVSALIGVAVLTTAGIVAVQTLGSGLGTFAGAGNEEQAPPPESVEAVIDPTATVVVLNGSETVNLQAGVEQVITENAWGTILFTDYAASREVPISAVFYAAPEDEGAAAGLAKELGGVSYYQSPPEYAEFGARLVVLLGLDYAGPGFDEAAQVTARMGGEEIPEDAPVTG